MKGKALFTLVFLVLGCKPATRITVETLKENQPLIETEALIKELASDAFNGRKSGHPDFELAMNYTEAYFKKEGVKPYFADSYRDTFLIKGKSTANIVAFIGDKTKDKKYVLIGAHLDHLGPSPSRTDTVYNGANDNASGVTAVLQMSKELNKYKFDYNIIIALFGAEEAGLAGSKHLAKRLKQERIDLAYMLNFEMLGKTLTSGTDEVYMTGFNKSDCAAKMNEIAGKEFVKFLPVASTYGLFRRSDNYAFYKEFNIPSHTFSTFDFENYKYYHEEGDEVSELDLENMNTIIHSATYVIIKMLQSKIEPTLAVSQK
ncbi:M28 family metallopeptidase [Fulvivirga sediminis]|uniref:M20/M25/M40 family metallo-hydrolase n=1 Tax=Fulvivirga sediminis TaxID=2803949 RepID=A0A937F7B6_9BACT|nr:M20/M25/M40 family metallo-hydrolase [Fulvivirga sediminis]MBL3655594.1 M20/M25/M40 family metallo-hydrolase [Fulvivirga sediminis]